MKYEWNNAYFVCKVYQLLTDLKEQRKDSGKNKHTPGQQNLNTIMYEVGDHPVLLFSHLPFTTNMLCVSYLHTLSSPSLSDAKVPVTDALQQAKSRDCKRVPNHNDASQTHKVSIFTQSHACCYIMFYI